MTISHPDKGHPTVAESHPLELPGGRLPPVQALLGIVVFLGAQVLAGLAAAGVAPLIKEPGTTTLFFAAYAALSLLGLAALLRGLAPADLRVTFARAGIAREVGLGTLIGAGLIGVGGLVMFAAGAYRGTDPSLNAGILLGLMLAVGTAVGEEVLFRGVLLRVLNARFGSSVAVAALSVLFGLAHVGNAGAGVLGAVAIAISAGLLLNVAYLLTGRLWLPIGIHFGWNAMQSAFFGTDVSGTGSGRGLFAGHLSGPEWLSGGAMGMEGSWVIMALGLGAGIALTVLAVRRGRWRSWSTARAETAQARAGRA